MSKSPTAFVDTTIHVDRVLSGHNVALMTAIDKLCSEYAFTLTSTFSKLEFKNVVLMGLQCVATYLEEEDSFVGAYNRASKVQTRRSSTLVNTAAFVQRGLDSKITIVAGDSLDQKLSEQALAYIYNAIEYLWRAFDKKVDQVVDALKCQRVKEAPERLASGEVRVRNQISRCKSGTCNVSGYYQSQARAVRSIVEKIELLDPVDMTRELKGIVDASQKAKNNASVFCSYNKCIGVGDLWIHLEGASSGASAMITRNYKESVVLCDAMRLDMRDPSAPVEQEEAIVDT